MTGRAPVLFAGTMSMDPAIMGRYLSVIKGGAMIPKLPEHEQRIAALETAVTDLQKPQEAVSGSISSSSTAPFATSSAVKGNVRWRLDVQETVQTQAATIQGLTATVARLERELDALRLLIYNGGASASTSNNKLRPDTRMSSFL